MSDADAILGLINPHAAQGLMLSKKPYDIYRNIMNFFVIEEEGKVVGCAKISIVWRDLAELVSLAVDSDVHGQGVGKQLVQACLDEAKHIGIARVFTLTLQCDFFSKCGFTEVPHSALPHRVFGKCLACPKADCCDEHAFVIDIK
jgi:amino-acid N-acetyltransferase